MSETSRDAAETEVIRKKALRRYWIALITGGLIFSVSMFVLIAPWLSGTKPYPGNILIGVFIGLAELVYAGLGFWDEKRQRKKKINV
jgi:hypothetical protein